MEKSGSIPHLVFASDWLWSYKPSLFQLVRSLNLLRFKAFPDEKKQQTGRKDHYNIVKNIKSN